MPFPGTIYSFMGGETGDLSEWPDLGWNFIGGSGGFRPVISSTRAKNGTYSFKHELPVAGVTDAHSSMAMQQGPNLVSMGGPGGSYIGGYYSMWVYLDNVNSGWNKTDWRMLLGWMTSVSGAPDPIG